MEIYKGQVVYFNSFKFGIVVNINTKSISIYFPEEKQIFNVAKESFEEKNNPNVVNLLTIYDVFNLKLLDFYFDSKIIYRAKSYANDTNIHLLLDTENKINANIYGTSIYKTQINFYNGIVSYSCTCPYEGNCKHLYSLILYIKKKHPLSKTISDIKANFIKPEDLKEFNLNKKIYSKNVYDFISFANANANYFKIYQKLEDFAHLNSKEEIIELASLIFDPKKSFYFYLIETLNFLKYYFSFKKEMRILLEKNEKFNKFKSNLYSLENVDINSSYHNINESLLYSFFNNDYSSLNRVLKECADFKFYIESRNEDLILNSLKYLNIDEKTADYLLDTISFNNTYLLYKSLKTIPLKTKYFTKLLKINFTNFKELPLEVNDIKLFIELCLNNYQVFNILSAYHNKLIENNEQIYLLYHLYKIYIDGELPHYKEVDNIINDLPNNEYIKKIFDSFHKNKSEDVFDSLQKYLSAFDNKFVKKSLEDYFDIFYSTENNEFKIYLTLKNSVISVFSVSFFKDNVFYISDFNYLYADQDLYMNDITPYLFKKYGKEAEDAINEFDITNKINILEEQNEIFIQTLNNIYEKNLLKNNIVNKVEIIPYFNNYFELISFKIGIDHFYQIKNILRFLEYINKEQLHSYGKNLSFVHSLTSFDEKSKKVISLFYEYQKTYIPPFDLDKLFNIYRGSYVFVLEEKYFVRLENLNLKLIIDKDGFLKSEKISQNYELLNNSYPFLINVSTKTIDIFSDNELINNLFVLLNQTKSSKISNVLDEFKYKFYYPNSSYFLIDPSLEKRFKKLDLKIESYIDFVNNSLVLETKYLKNHQEININLINQNDQYLLNFYNELITNLGFVNQKMSDNIKIWQFLNSDLKELKNISKVYFSDSILNKKINYFKSPKLKINYQSGLLDILLEESEFSDEELIKIFDSIKKKKSFILINDKFIGLNNAESTKFYNEIQDFNLLKNKTLEKHKRLPLYYVFKNSDLINRGEIEIIDELYNELINFKTLKFEIPSSINASLRDYQKEGFNWLKVLYKYNLGGILADDMGLGKTLEIITFLISLNINSPILIVTPTSLIYNWINEFNKFCDIKIDVIPIYGSISLRNQTIEDIKENKKTIYITSYESLRNDCDKYKDITFDILILDEAQFIKNADALKTKSVKSMKSNNRFVLTGTPIENSVLDLWSIFDFLMPNFLPNLTEFKYRYENEENYSSEIKKLVSPFILRRNKNDVLKDLPDKYEVLLTCEMNKEQQKIYDAEILNARNELESNSTTFQILPTLTKLREICIDPSLYIENYKGESSKIITLLESLDEELKNGNKVLIFSQFVSALEIVKEKLKEKNISYNLIIGATKSQERIKISQDFNFNNKYQVLLISLKAGGTGLNLVGANVVIHLDPWWNYAIEEQASDRAYRIGQTRNVKIIKLIVANSIEQRVIELQKIKKDVAFSIISNDDSSITSLKKEDILYILDKN